MPTTCCFARSLTAALSIATIVLPLLTAFVEPVTAQAISECPESSTEVFSGSSPGLTEFTFNLARCQEVTFTIEACDNYNHFNAVLEVKVYGAHVDPLMHRFAGTPGPAGCETTVLPFFNTTEGSPLPGTIGPGGHPARLTVFSNQTSTYTITVTKTSEPGYNIGGRSFADAPLLSPLPAAMKARIHQFDDGQFYRVRLAVGGTLQLTGTATKVNCYFAYVQVLAYRSPSDPAPYPLLSDYPTPGVGICGTQALTSRVYTNTSGQVEELYLKLFAYGYPIESVDLVITGNEAPPTLTTTLRLFLNADGNFSTTSPTSDHASYVPGADLGSGASVGLPQPNVELIAAYVDDATGQVVAPPSQVQPSFSLIDVSAFAGYAMNSPAASGSDFSLSGGSSPQSVSWQQSDNTARITLLCFDYGGWATAQVEHQGNQSGFMRLPMDEDGNLLPDVGWRVGGVPVPGGGAADQDADGTGTGGSAGDGLSRFEEYRGFMAKGLHIRTHSDAKDLFVVSVFPQGIGHGGALPLQIHMIAASELNTAQRITFNSANAGYGPSTPGNFPMKGVRIRDLGDNAVEPGTTGVTQMTTMGDPTSAIGPNGVQIYPLVIRRLSPRKSQINIAEQFDEPKLLQTIAHELGHAVGIGHQYWPIIPPTPWRPPCGALATSMMVAQSPSPNQAYTYFRQTTDASDCAWNNIPTMFDSIDLPQIRLRP